MYIFSLLYLKAHDADVGQNSNLEYTIMDAVSNQYFQIDFLTGNIQLLQKLDYELIKEFTFNVMVSIFLCNVKSLMQETRSNFELASFTATSVSNSYVL